MAGRAWKPPHVEVTWLDAMGDGALHGTRGAIIDKANLSLRQTSGYLVHQDGEEVEAIRRRTILAHDYDPPNTNDPNDAPSVGNITVIPSLWILKVRYKDKQRRKKEREANGSGG